MGCVEGLDVVCRVYRVRAARASTKDLYSGYCPSVSHRADSRGSVQSQEA